MIISCPACATRYNIDPKALGEKGRKVRCSNCAHQWIQAPPVSEEEMDLPQGLRAALAPEQEDEDTQLWDGSGEDQVLDQFGVEDDIPAEQPARDALEQDYPEQDETNLAGQFLEDDDLNASQRVLHEIGNQDDMDEDDYHHQSYQQDIAEDMPQTVQETVTEDQGAYYQVEDIDAAFEQEKQEKGGSPFPIGWAIFIVLLLIAAGGVFFAKDTIISMIPSAEDFLGSEQEYGEEDGAGNQGLQLLQPRVQQQTVQYGTQQVEVFELVGDIVNNSDRDIKLPKLRAVVLDADQKQLDSWIFSANKPNLAPGEKTSYSTEVENTNEQDVNILIDFVASDNQ